jgi:SOS-response transcriptional repressor LexA
MDLFEARRESLQRLIDGPRFRGSQAAFCQATKIAASYLSRMLKEPGEKDRKRIGDDMALKIENALNLPAGELLHPKGTGRAERSNVIDIEPRRRVPLISWVQAGDFEEVQDHHAPGAADEWVDVYDTKPGDSSFALRVQGDSMTSPYPGELSFPEGTIIVVDPTRGANAGDFVVAKDVQTQQATFKKLTTDGGRWYLKPLNPSYPTIEIDDPSMRVIGRVIEYQVRGKL